MHIGKLQQISAKEVCALKVLRLVSETISRLFLWENITLLWRSDSFKVFSNSDIFYHTGYTVTLIKYISAHFAKCGNFCVRKNSLPVVMWGMVHASTKFSMQTLKKKKKKKEKKKCKSLMAQWLGQGVSVTWNVLSWSGGHEFEPGRVKLGVCGTSVLSRTWTKIS